MAYTLERSQTYRRWLVVVLTLLFGVGLWSAADSHAATAAVSIDDGGFNPPSVTVAVGDTVHWTNDHGTTAHAPQDQQTGKFNSPDLQPGDSFSYTTTSLGDISYLCRIHTFMTGTIHVVPAGGGTTTTTAAPSTTTTTTPSTTTTTTPGSTTTTAPSTTTTSTPGTTTTTAPGSTTTTSTPDTTTTTTTPPSGSPGFQDVPNDPSADYPPGTPGSRGAPPSSAPQTTSTTSTTIPPGPGFQDVPNDPSADRPPGHMAP